MKLRFEIKITLLYLLLGGLWILFSDKILLAITQNKEALSQLQTYKGWFFILITGLFFYSFVRKQLLNLEHSEKNLEKTNSEIKAINKTLVRKNQEIEQINRELEYSRDKALESNRLKTAFLENMSHEIRTPLNGIVGFSELLCEKGITQDEKIEFKNIISQNSLQLIDIIHDILDISALKTEQVKPIFHTVSIAELLQEAHHRWEKDALSKNIKFHKPQYPDDIIQSDYNALKKIIDKLLHNAIKYTEKGSVQISASIDDGFLSINVSDTGTGIEEALQKNIFEPFYQIELPNKGINNGNGLGLNIAKEYAGLLNGTISCISTPSQGSVFRIKIPVSKHIPMVQKPDSNKKHQQTP